MKTNYKKSFLKLKEQLKDANNYYNTVTENCEYGSEECVYYSGYSSGISHALSLLEELEEAMNPDKKDDFF